MQPRAILFDKDGTLVGLFETWIPAYRSAAEYLAEAAGEPELAEALLTMGGYDPLRDVLRPDTLLSCGSNGQIIAAWRSHPAVAKLGDIEQAVLDIFYEQTVHQATPVTPLRPLLTSLKRRGLKLGLSTMDNTESAKECMRALGVFDLMDFICGYDAGFGAKPDPGMALAFAEAIEHPIDQVMMVGDALVDFQMARSAGCSVTVGVLTGAASRQELSPHADHVIAHIGELPQLLDQLS